MLVVNVLFTDAIAKDGQSLNTWLPESSFTSTDTAVKLEHPLNALAPNVVDLLENSIDCTDEQSLNAFSPMKRVRSGNENEHKLVQP